MGNSPKFLHRVRGLSGQAGQASPSESIPMNTGPTFSHAYGGTYAPQPSAPVAPSRGTSTHEAFISAVRDAVAARIIDADNRARLLGAKVVYGVGSLGSSVRGVCYYGAWSGTDAFIEVAAIAQQDFWQIAGTTIHECAHAVAGHAAGHGKDWKAVCKQFGLADAAAAGQHYEAASFDPEMLALIESLPKPDEGKPTLGSLGVQPRMGGIPGKCPAGRGSRGGKVGGKGSGSRLRLFICACASPVRVRVAHDTFEATCKVCGTDFVRG